MTTPVTLTVFKISYRVEGKPDWQHLNIAAPSLRLALDKLVEMGISLDDVQNVLNTRQIIDGVVVV